MEADHQFERRLLGRDQSGDPHPRTHHLDPGVEVARGDASGVAGEFGDFEGESGGAQIEAGEQLASEVDLVVGEAGVSRSASWNICTARCVAGTSSPRAATAGVTPAPSS
ncbi:hypothetical protein [Streptodolium elevatio]|uniref:Uncharacterized protein n=1 Tax=Streptodolium elevatio TaxID=3157996 RepID=A0ABV3DJ94_9ACTN